VHALSRRVLEKARCYAKLSDSLRPSPNRSWIFLCLIPEECGGSDLGLSAAAAILETIQSEGCNGAACHAKLYSMGTILRHGSEEQKVLARNCLWPLAIASVRRNRAHEWNGHWFASYDGSQGRRSTSTAPEFLWDIPSVHGCADHDDASAELRRRRLRLLNNPKNRKCLTRLHLPGLISERLCGLEIQFARDKLRPSQSH
jgi:acyl-CoA dehydrogenase-like protein